MTDLGRLLSARGARAGLGCLSRALICFLVPVLGACGSGSSDDTSASSAAGTTASTAPSASTTPSTSTATIAAASCKAPLVSIQTGSDTTCQGGGVHQYPVGMRADQCHGWRAADTKGELHDNSANNIRCNGDGSFSFDQYAGNLSCSGTPTTKTFVPGKCQQDRPPTLYSIPVDMSCCSAPGTSACKTDVPSVAVAGATIYLNNQQCVP